MTLTTEAQERYTYEYYSSFALPDVDDIGCPLDLNLAKFLKQKGYEDFRIIAHVFSYLNIFYEWDKFWNENGEKINNHGWVYLPDYFLESDLLIPIEEQFYYLNVLESEELIEIATIPTPRGPIMIYRIPQNS